jgi:hypothetical protein
VLWFEWKPENKAKLLARWRDFKFPKEVKVIGRYLLIGRHISVAIFEAPSEESILKITYPFGEIGIAHAAPALPLEDAFNLWKRCRLILLLSTFFCSSKILPAQILTAIE